MSESILSRPRESSEERTGATAVRDAVRARRARGAWLWGLALAVVVGGCGASAGTQRPWQRVTTPSFEVLGQVEEQTVTALAIQLETFRQVAMALTHTSASPATLPTRVLVFANDDALKAFSGQRQAVGMYSSSDRQRVLILSGENRHFSALEILCHEYVHLLLERSSVSYPSWYEEGLAEFLSTTEVRDGKARLGRPPARYGLRSMQQGRSAPTGSHIQLDLNGESGDDFYSRAWATVAYLTLGHLAASHERDQRAALGKFLQLYSRGRDHDEAVREAFGFDYEALRRKVVAYVRQDKFPLIDMPVALSPVEPSVPDVLNDHERDLALASAAIVFGRDAVAARYYERVLAVGPEPRALAGLALVRERQGRSDEATALLERALAWPKHPVDVELDAVSVYIARADRTEDEQERRRLAAQAVPHAERAVAAAPEMPAGYVALGMSLAVDSSRRADAITALQRAHGYLPRSVWVNIHLAYLHFRRGELAECRKHVEAVRRVRNRVQSINASLESLTKACAASAEPAAPAAAASAEPAAAATSD